MKRIKFDLQSLVKNLKVLSQKVERIAKEVDRLDKARAAAKKKAAPKRAPKKVVKKPAATKKKAKPTATDTVLGIVRRSKKGVDTTIIKQKTGYDDRKIWSILQRAYKQGKIKRVKKGTYVGA